MINGQREISAAELEKNVLGRVDKSAPKLSLHVHHSLSNAKQQTHSVVSGSVRIIGEAEIKPNWYTLLHYHRRIRASRHHTR